MSLSVCGRYFSVQMVCVIVNSFVVMGCGCLIFLYYCVSFLVVVCVVVLSHFLYICLLSKHIMIRYGSK